MGSGDLIRALSWCQRLLVGAALTAVSLAVAAATESELLLPLLTPLLGLGVASLLFGLHALATERLGKRAAATLSWGAFGMAVALALLAYLSFRHNQGTSRLCDIARGDFGSASDSLERRRSAQREADERLSSALALVPRWLGAAPHSCDWSRRDLARVARGLCPQQPIVGIPCRCGSRNWPADTGCQSLPSCVFDGPGPEQFNCWRDTLPGPRPHP